MRLLMEASKTGTFRVILTVFVGMLLPICVIDLSRVCHGLAAVGQHTSRLSRLGNRWGGVLCFPWD